MFLLSVYTTPTFFLFVQCCFAIGMIFRSCVVWNAPCVFRLNISCRTYVTYLLYIPMCIARRFHVIFVLLHIPSLPLNLYIIHTVHMLWRSVISYSSCLCSFYLFSYITGEIPIDSNDSPKFMIDLLIFPSYFRFLCFLVCSRISLEPLLFTRIFSLFLFKLAGYLLHTHNSLWFITHSTIIPDYSYAHPLPDFYPHMRTSTPVKLKDHRHSKFDYANKMYMNTRKKILN